MRANCAPVLSTGRQHLSMGSKELLHTADLAIENGLIITGGISLPATDPHSNRPRDAVIAFEGGGARGVAHIGFLKEVNNSQSKELRRTHPHIYATWPKYNIVGAAGSSIGALVAALVAVGYRADDMIDANLNEEDRQLRPAGPLKGSQILAAAGLPNVTETFGRDYWWRIWLLRLVARHAAISSMGLLLTWLGVGYLSLLASRAVLQYFPFSNRLDNIASLIAAGLTPPLLLFLLSRFVIRGVCSMRPVMVHVDKALNYALLKNHGIAVGCHPVFPKTPLLIRFIKSPFAIFQSRKNSLLTDDSLNFLAVKFKHLPMPLKIVATNITSKKLTVFSQDHTPDIPVAAAVAASMALPVVFRNVSIDGAKYYDGGLVSNLPVWSFDNDRILRPDLATITSELAPAKAPPPKGFFAHSFFSPFRSIRDMVRASLFGVRALEHRFSSNFSVMSDPAISVLDFDAAGSEIQKEISRARVKFRLTMQAEYGLRRHRAVIASEITRLIARRFRPAGRLKKPAVVRTAILMRSQDAGLPALETVWMHSSPGTNLPYPDEALLYPLIRTLPGESFRTGQLHFVQMRAPFRVNAERLLWGSYNRRAQRNVWEHCEWAWSIPVDINGSANAERAVILVSSNMPSSYFDIDFIRDQKSVNNTLIKDIYDLASELPGQWGRAQGETKSGEKNAP